MKQDGVWLLYSSEYMTASECKRLGLAFKVTADFHLMNEAYRLCGILAKQPIASLIATKKLIVQGKADAILEAHKREQAQVVQQKFIKKTKRHTFNKLLV